MNKDLARAMELCSEANKGKLATMVAMLERRPSVSSLISKLLKEIPNITEAKLIEIANYEIEEKNEK